MKRIVLATLLILALVILCSCSLLPCKHTEVVDAAVAPTCTEMGLTEGKHCSKCGEITQPQQSVLAYGHTQVVDKAVDSTCTSDGLTSGVHCSVCNETIIAQNVVPASHTFGEWERLSESDCLFNGEEKRTCSVCDYAEIRELETLSHSFAVDEESGLHTCTICGSVIFKGHLYAVVDHRFVWYDAFAECESIGGHLATITSVEEQAFISYLMSKAGSDIYWIGGVKNVSGWEWITGEKFGDFTNWRPTMPDNSKKSEYFLQVYGHNSSYEAGLWNDLDASMKNHPTLKSAGYICEWELDLSEENHTYCDWINVSEPTCFVDGEERRFCIYCGVEESRAIDKISHSFILDEASGISYCEICSAASYNGNAYLIVKNAMTWFDAYKYCKSLGGELVSITSAEEQEFINSYMTAKSQTSQVWIGLYGYGDEWYWTSGEKCEYTNWHPSQPDYASGKQFFGALNWKQLGTWDDANHTLKYVFICEWNEGGN